MKHDTEEVNIWTGHLLSIEHNICILGGFGDWNGKAETIEHIKNLNREKGQISRLLPIFSWNGVLNIVWGGSIPTTPLSLRTLSIIDQAINIKAEERT